jgi:hypothetical protein
MSFITLTFLISTGLNCSIAWELFFTSHFCPNQKLPYNVPFDIAKKKQL